MRFLLNFDLMALVVVLAATVAVASTEEHSDLAKRKQDLMADIDGHISALKEMKTCVGAAGSDEDIKKCREAKEAKERELHAKHGEKNK